MKRLPKILQKRPIRNNLSITKNNITFGNLTEELRQKYIIPQDKMGIVITNINQESIDDISKLEELYENAKKSDKQNILLLIERGSSNMFVPLQVM